MVTESGEVTAHVLGVPWEALGTTVEDWKEISDSFDRDGTWGDRLVKVNEQALVSDAVSVIGDSFPTEDDRSWEELGTSLENWKNISDEFEDNEWSETGTLYDVNESVNTIEKPDLTALTKFGIDETLDLIADGSVTANSQVTVTDVKTEESVTKSQSEDVVGTGGSRTKEDKEIKPRVIKEKLSVTVEAPIKVKEFLEKSIETSIVANQSESFTINVKQLEFANTSKEIDAPIVQSYKDSLKVNSSIILDQSESFKTNTPVIQTNKESFDCKWDQKETKKVLSFVA